MHHQVDTAWLALPEACDLSKLPESPSTRATACSSSTAAQHPVMIFDRDGRFEGSWGDGALRPARTESRSGRTMRSISRTISTIP